MNELNQLLFLGNSIIDPSLPKEERFNLIYTHLRDRNANNQRFIAKFINKIQKKFHHREVISCRNLQTCPSVTPQEESRLQPTQSLPFCQRFHTEEMMSHGKDQFGAGDPHPFQTNLRSSNDLQIQQKKKLLRRQRRESEGKSQKSSRNDLKEDQGFKKYLKKVYLNETSVIKPASLLQAPAGRKSNQPITNKQKCLNIKSMVFGCQDLNSQSQKADVVEAAPPEPLERATIQHQDAVPLERGGNLFLPSIGQQSLPRRERGKGERRGGEKMMRVQEGGSEGQLSKCRALWLCESLSGMGLSFRINTIQIKRSS